MLWFTSQKRQGLDKNKDNSSLTTTQATGCVSLVNPKSVRELGPRGYSNVWIFRLSRHFSLFYPESFTPKLANMSICHATIIRAATFFTPMWDNSVNLSKRGIARVLWDARELGRTFSRDATFGPRPTAHASWTKTYDSCMRFHVEIYQL